MAVARARAVALRVALRPAEAVHTLALTAPIPHPPHTQPLGANAVLVTLFLPRAVHAATVAVVVRVADAQTVFQGTVLT